MVLDARNTVWNVLLPACDGDVNNLQGVKPFDRMMVSRAESSPAQKSTYFVYGANHNFFNTEWQESDSPGCVGVNNPQLWTAGDIGSEDQRNTSRASLLALFRGNVYSPTAGAYDYTFNANFNPSNGLLVPASTVKRGFTNSPDPSVTSDCSTVLEDFNQSTGTSSCGVANCASKGITIAHPTFVPNHATQLTAAQISWQSPEAFTTNSQPPGAGADISGYATLDFRISRQNSALNPPDPTDFLVSLVLDDGTDCGAASDPVALSWYLDPLEGPVGGISGGLHPILQTIRIPLPDFGLANLTQVRGVRFDVGDGAGTPTGAIYMSNIRLSSDGGPAPAPLEGLAQSLGRFAKASSNAPVDSEEVASTNVVADIRRVTNGAIGGAGVEIELFSDRAFPVRGELPVLQIGNDAFSLSGYPADGDTHRLIFSLSEQQFAQASAGASVSVQYGAGEGRDRWEFGTFEKVLR